MNRKKIVFVFSIRVIEIVISLEVVGFLILSSVWKVEVVFRLLLN